MRPAAKIVTISPNVNISRQVSLLWGVQSINSRDANGWKDMMSISKEIIKKLKFIKKNKGKKTESIKNKSAHKDYSEVPKNTLKLIEEAEKIKN